ncbi:MAG TPA: hypothetical protein VMA32_03730 [Streptosporangiaceae bacterium]|nr:hypothetical protein [Streptosporangiaceae bacterium]
MSPTPDTTAGNGGSFGPEQAAALLDQTTHQARRKFQPNPPVLNVFRAIVVLVAFGGIWASVRGQHPYTGPSAWAITLAYVLIAIVIGWSASALRRAGAGVTGPTQRARNVGIGVLLVAWVLVYVFMGALYHAGVSHEIIYGLYPATAPLMIVGLVGAANAAGREDWPMVGTTLPVAIVAAIAAFGGPVNAWLIMGIGLCAAMLGAAAVAIWQQRRSVVRP